MMVNNVRRTGLLQNAVAHNDDAVSDGHRFNLVMRYVNHGRFVNFVDADKLRPRLLAKLGIKVGKRFVKQKVRRLFYQRPAQCNTLLLAAGKVFRLAVFVALQIQNFQCFRSAPFNFVLAQLLDFQTEGNVIPYGKECYPIRKGAGTARSFGTPLPRCALREARR